MAAIDLSQQPDPSVPMKELLRSEKLKLDTGQIAALEAFDFEAGLTAWVARTKATIVAKPPGDQFDHLSFAIIYIPLPEDMDNVYTEIIVGSEEDFDPLEENGCAYGDYCPYPDYVPHHSPFLTAVYRQLVEGETENQDAQLALEEAWARLCVDRLCRQEAMLLLGGREQRLIFVGWNEPAELLGAVTKLGWNPRLPKESERKFLARLDSL